MNYGAQNDDAYGNDVSGDDPDATNVLESPGEPYDNESAWH